MESSLSDTIKSHANPTTAPDRGTPGTETRKTHLKFPNLANQPIVNTKRDNPSRQARISWSQAKIEIFFERSRAAPKSVSGGAAIYLSCFFDLRFLAFFLAAFFFAAFFFAAFFGTFIPSALASESAIAIACFRLLTFRPERPLLSVPALRFFIARPTLADAFFEYFRAISVLPVTRKQSS